MLELSILAPIVLAGVYWAALWLMGRHEDVLYGDFVTAAGNAELPPPPVPEPPPRLVAPEIPRRPQAAAHAAPQDVFARRAVAGKRDIGAGGDVERATGATLSSKPAQPRPPRPTPRLKAPVSAAPLLPVGTDTKATRGPLAAPAGVLRQDRPTSVTLPPMVPPRPAFISQLAAQPRRSGPPQNDLLAALLETIKRDLDDAVGKQR